MSCQGQGFHNWQTTLFVADLAKYPCYLLVSAPLSLSSYIWTGLMRHSESQWRSLMVIRALVGKFGEGFKMNVSLSYTLGSDWHSLVALSSLTLEFWTRPCLGFEELRLQMTKYKELCQQLRKINTISTFLYLLYPWLDCRIYHMKHEKFKMFSFG